MSGALSGLCDLSSEVSEELLPSLSSLSACSQSLDIKLAMAINRFHTKSFFLAVERPLPIHSLTCSQRGTQSFVESFRVQPQDGSF